MKNNYIVYIHTCPNGKVYIVITSQKPTKRWGNGKGYIRNEHFYNAILKYGWSNIKHDILYENVSKEFACKKEQELISKYKSNNRKYGYNNSIGGEFGSLGIKYSEQKKIEISIRHKGEGNPFYNKHHTEEAKKRIKSKLIGRKHTDTEIINMIKASPKKKRVYQYTTDNKLVNSYESKRQAIRETGIDMGKVLINKKKTAGGYRWSYDKVA